ncbi:CHAT domain-containing protein [Streptomyces sp. AcH 505]|uniref:CHAT domain-containing protein n=1 Tax=Streptomyces sp. AcH 505 TaxID=352211 RepID=UPI0012FEC959
MTDLRAVVDRALARCGVAWSPEAERQIATAGTDPQSWLPAATGLLRASWSGDETGRASAVAAAALMEFALDTGPREHPERPSWVLHLWLAERTLSFRYGDYQLSRDVHHHLGAQTQGRAADDPVLVAATYLGLPLPRHFQPVQQIEQSALRLVAMLPPDDLGRCCVLVRLAQAACFRYESGDQSALDDAWQRAREAYDCVTTDHLEAELVGRTAVHAGVSWFRAHPQDRSAVDFALRAGRAAVAAVEFARERGSRHSGYETASVHLLMAMALMAVVSHTLETAEIDEAMEHLEVFRAEGPPDDRGLYAVNMAPLLAVRAFFGGSAKDIARADELMAALQADLPADSPLHPHIVQKRQAFAELPRLIKLFPFGTAGVLRRLRPMLGPLLGGAALPSIQMYAPPPSPGYHSPGPGPEDFADILGRAPRPGAGPGGASGVPPTGRPDTFNWPAGPQDVPSLRDLRTPFDPQKESDRTGLPPHAEAVSRGLFGSAPTANDPRRLALAEDELRARLAERGLDDGRRGWTATVLVFALAAKYVFSENVDELRTAVNAGDEVLATLPPTSSRYVDLLCAVEFYRHGYGFLHQDTETVRRACGALGWALGRLPEGSWQWLGCALQYASVLADEAVLLRDPVKVREAHRLYTAAARGLEGPPDGIRLPGGAGDELARQWQVLRVQLDMLRTKVELAVADVIGDLYAVEETDVRWDPDAETRLPPWARFENARAALGREMERPDWDRAADAAAVALAVLPLLTSSALRRDDRQAVVRSALLGRRYPDASAARRAADIPDQLAGTSLGRTGCAVAITANRIDQAAVLLEQGRAVLMSQDLEARTDISVLAAAHPAEAAEFTAVGERMWRAEDATAPDEATRVGTQHAVAEEWQRLLDRIRSLPGFGDFLLPPTVAQMRAEAAQGPIVLVNIDRLRCDALVVTLHDIKLVPLQISEGQLAHTAKEFLEAAAVDRDAALDRKDAARETVFTTLEWLWDTVAQPVLDAAGFTGPIPDGTPRSEIPRLWWSTSGPLAHLPIHAAGYQRKEALGERRSVLDRVASSYTPSIRALHHARQAPTARCDAGAFLAVSQPTGDNGSDGASGDEVDAITRTLRGLRVIAGADAGVEHVLAELRSAAAVHFACHGISDPDDPSKSRLELADGPLDVLSVTRQRLPQAQLAVLLACHTARSDRLPDEAIHVTSAFLTAGYPQVVGALWGSADLASVLLTEKLYRSLRHYGAGLDVTDTSRALHGIVRQLRKRYVKAPAMWAQYIHTGR